MKFDGHNYFGFELSVEGQNIPNVFHVLIEKMVLIVVFEKAFNLTPCDPG